MLQSDLLLKTKDIASYLRNTTKNEWLARLDEDSHVYLVQNDQPILFVTSDDPHIIVRVNWPKNEYGMDYKGSCNPEPQRRGRSSQIRKGDLAIRFLATKRASVIAAKILNDLMPRLMPAYDSAYTERGADAQRKKVIAETRAYLQERSGFDTAGRIPGIRSLFVNDDQVSFQVTAKPDIAALVLMLVATPEKYQTHAVNAILRLFDAGQRQEPV